MTHIFFLSYMYIFWNSFICSSKPFTCLPLMLLYDLCLKTRKKKHNASNSNRKKWKKYCSFSMRLAEFSFCVFSAYVTAMWQMSWALWISLYYCYYYYSLVEYLHGFDYWTLVYEKKLFVLALQSVSISHSTH